MATGGSLKFPSPNHGPRPHGARPTLIVIHATNMVDAASARARLCDPASEVSCHWLISDDGATEQLVDEARRAWHAGAGSWRGGADVNSRSIGIELANPMYRPFTEPQMAALERLLGEVMSRWNIAPDAVIAHSDMSPDRKDDPGPRFDWARLARQGLACAAEPDEERPLTESLDAAGYPPAPHDARLRAFRLRHRPWATGPEHPEDRRLAAGLVPRG